MAQSSRRERIARVREYLRRPAVIHVTTTIVPVKRDPGAVCPITNSDTIRAIDEIPDLSVLIRDDGTRLNRWEQTGAALDRFDALASKAEHYAGASGLIWHVPIVFRCPADHVEDLLDDQTQTLYWSAGWRSGKTYRGLQWWVRGWVKYGSRGERFWLVGPQQIHAYRLMQKAFVGRNRVAPILPTRNNQPVLAHDIPERATKRELSFPMIDGSIVELQHAKGEGGRLEGESVRRILFDEAWNTTSGGPYEVMLGRVMEDFGQVGISSVPDEECEWLYEKVVAEFERTKEDADCQFKVVELSGYQNPWIDPEAIRRREKTTPDKVTRENKIYGKWTRRGLYYYADVWNPSRFTRDEVSHEAEAWGLGPDITAQVCKSMLRKSTKSGHIGAVDFSDGGKKATTRVWFKVFGELEDWQTWNLVAVDEEQTRSDSIEAAAESRIRNHHAYEGSAVVGDANGFNRGKGGKRRDDDSRHWENAGFAMVAPVRHASKDGTRPTYENPRMGASRTSLREIMRRGRFWVNAGKCPGLLNALNKAPNRRKSNNDKNTWIEVKVYGYEDCLRYAVWRIFHKHQSAKQKAIDEETAKVAEELTAHDHAA